MPKEWLVLLSVAVRGATKEEERGNAEPEQGLGEKKRNVPRGKLTCHRNVYAHIFARKISRAISFT